MDKMIEQITKVMLDKYGKDATVAYLQGMLQIAISELCKTDREYMMRTIQRHIDEEK
jgi:cytochrome b involved in lipid metabolism